VSHSYRAYGLGIVSSTSIAGLESLPADVGSPDVFLDTGPEPDWARLARELPGRVISHLPGTEDAAEPNFNLTEHGRAECYDLAYSDGTRFVVDAAARRVWGTYRAPLTSADLATYFLGPVMGFLLRKRHVMCLHASCVELGGHGVALCGDAGVGKSTTAAALALRGFPVLAEDIVPLDESGGVIRAVPGYPRVCLWPDSVAKLLGAEEALPRLTPAWEKRYLALDGDGAKFSGEKLPLGAIYLFAPRSDDAAAPRVEQMRPREALFQLVQNTYMNWLLDREQRAIEFDALVRLVRQVPVRRIVPHVAPSMIARLCELIVKDFGAALAEQHSPSSQNQP